jgi:D-alanyl-D-alanine carboxypeptidase
LKGRLEIGVTMRHLITTCLAGLALGVGFAAAAAQAAPTLVFDVASGKVIEHGEAFQRWYPASLTKLMTVYVAFRAMQSGEVEPTSPIRITRHAASQPPSKMGYKPGNVLTLDNALKIMMVKSANDIATAVGDNLGGSEEGFAKRMNDEARRLGMTGSNWVNANGLPAPGQYTTARDLAILVRALRTEFPQYADYFSIEALRSGKNTIRSYNLLIGRYAGADGMKTGFICSSGFNLVATATRDGRTLAAVVLGAASQEGRAELAAELLEKGFSEPLPAQLTISSLQPYGPPTVDQVVDMRETVCSKQAQADRWDGRDVEGKMVINSPYIVEMTRPPKVVAIRLGGATGKVPPAMADAEGNAVADVPIPTWRPDMPPPVFSESAQAASGTL